MNETSKVIVVHKEKGCTSFDVVSKIRKIFGIKKVGHTGTLDPMAEGVLIVCIGQATKIVELLTAEDKEYIATVKLGMETDTLDLEGKVIKEQEVPESIELEKVLSSFQKKTYLQEVPIYSAVKVNGKKLYEYARNKEEISLPKKEVTIKEMKLLNQEKDEFTFKTLVTKGCYIRSLIRDIGVELNVPTTMTSLIRTKQGKVTLEESYTLEEIEKGEYKSYSIEEVLPYPTIIVEDEQEFKISNGISLEDKWNIQDKVIFKTKDNQLLGIYEKKDDVLKTWKNFAK